MRGCGERLRPILTYYRAVFLSLYRFRLFLIVNASSDAI